MSAKTTNKLVKTLTKIAYGALPVIAAFGVVGITIRYFGDKPVLSDIAKGLKGDVVGLFK